MKSIVKIVIAIVFLVWGTVNVALLFSEPTDPAQFNPMPNIMAIFSLALEYEVYKVLSRLGLTHTKLEED